MLLSSEKEGALNTISFLRNQQGTVLKQNVNPKSLSVVKLYFYLYISFLQKQNYRNGKLISSARVRGGKGTSEGGGGSCYQGQHEGPCGDGSVCLDWCGGYVILRVL